MSHHSPHSNIIVVFKGQRYKIIPILKRISGKISVYLCKIASRKIAKVCVYCFSSFVQLLLPVFSIQPSFFQRLTML